jgi:hypothetical protein
VTPRAGIALLLLLCIGGARPALGIELGKLQAYQTGNFTIYTSRDEAQVQHLVAGLAQFQQTLETLLQRKAGDAGMPTNIFILDHDDWTHVRPTESMLGVFWAGRFENQLGLMGEGDLQETLRVIFHEYTHYFLSANYNHEFPAWYQEGLAELLATASFENFQARFSVPESRWRDVQAGEWIPFDRLLAVDPGSPEYLEHRLARSFYGQSWLLLHYAMIHDHDFSKKMFDYLGRVNRGGPSAEAARLAFGDLQAVDAELRAYARRSQLSTGVLQIGEAPVRELSAGRAVPETEALVRLAEFMVALRHDPARIEPFVAALEAHSPGSTEAAVLRLRIAHLRDDRSRFAAGVKDLVPRLSPGDWRSRRDIGVLLFERAGEDDANREKNDLTNPDLKLALRLFDEGLSRKPDDARLLWGYGATAVRLQRNLQSAEQRLVAARRQLPTSDTVVLALATLYGMQGAVEKMIPVLGELIRHTRQPEVRRWATTTRERARQVVIEKQKAGQRQPKQNSAPRAGG